MENKDDFSLKKLFTPLTTTKAVHWIIFIGLLVFGNILFNGFVWDDKTYLLNNIDVRTLNISYLFGPNTWNNGLYYRPLTAVYFSLLYNFFNFTPFFYHFLQVIFHIIDSILLFFIFKKFFTKQLAFFLSLLFLVHPMQVESVAFISATLSPLSFLFGALALLLSLNDKINAKRTILIFLLLFISLLIKETGVLFFLFVLLYRILFHFRKREILIYLSVDILLGLLYLFLRYSVGKVSLVTAKGTIVSIAGLNFFQRVENIPAIIFYYLKTFFYPAQLAIDQQWIVTRISGDNFFLPLFLDTLFFLLAILFGVYLQRRHNKLYKPFVFFFVWFVLSLGFHIQLFPLDMTVADRFFYFPLAGLVGMIGVLIAFGVVTYKSKEISSIIFIIAFCILGLLSVRTMIRNANWHDEIMLYSHDLKIYDSMNDEVNLGSDYAALQNYQEALLHYQRGVMIRPTELDLYDLGFEYEELGNFQKAQSSYERALTNYQYPADQHILIITSTVKRLAYVYLFLGQDKKARDFITKQLRIFPTQGYLWEYLTISEYRLHNNSAALSALKNAKKYLSGSEINYIQSQILTNKPINIELLSSIKNED